MAFQFDTIIKPSAVDALDWSDWKWQIKNAIKTKDELQKHIVLTEDEKNYFLHQEKSNFRFQVTPYSLELIKQKDSGGSLRKILIGSSKEFLPQAQGQEDPLNEKNNNPVQRVIHRYSDRALFLVTDFCSVYCRYCTRKHFTAKDQVFPKKDEYENAIEYFKSHAEIKEVILSGGDPFTLSDEKILKIVKDLRQIPHIEIIRIGTRVPVVMPFRIKNDFLQELKKYHPIYIMTHFNHPDELTSEAKESLSLFVDNGFPVFNQMVLLNGVNNEASLVQALSRRLLYLRVKPYYMFQCDPSKGSDHLRTSIEDSLAIQKELWGHLSGLAMPQFSVDIPSGGGKASLVPDFVKKKSNSAYLFEGWDGVIESYINPDKILKPHIDLKYQKEWDLISSSQ